MMIISVQCSCLWQIKISDSRKHILYDHHGSGRLAQLVRATRLHRVGQGFDPSGAHHFDLINNMYTVYIIRNNKGLIYKGYTNNLEKRMNQHNENTNFVSYTSKKGPWKLIYKELFNNEQQARTREKFFKSGKGREFLRSLLGAYPPEADG